MTIIRDAAAIAAADTADLVETYNALTGKSIKKFENRATAERRVEMAIMAAKDADGHTGVPKGAEGKALDRAAIVEKAAAKGIPTPPALDEEDPKFEPGSLADQLNKAAAAAKPIAPREKAERKPGAPAKQSIYAVQATFKGTSKPQAGSVRNNILVHIQNADRSAITIEALDKHFELNSRGYVQKLLEKDHLIILDAVQYE
jgi:hypothetical protein